MLNKNPQREGSPFSYRGYCHNRSYSTNDYINKLSEKVKTEYDNLPDYSVIKRPESLVYSRMVLSYSDVIVTLYGLVPNKEMKDYFHIPENCNLPGIYCFISKDGLSYYIGSSLNMRTRYNRHLFNLKQNSDSN